MVSVCGRWAGALPERAGGAGRHGRASGPFGGVPPGDASDKDKIVYCKDGMGKGSYANQGFDSWDMAFGRGW